MKETNKYCVLDLETTTYIKYGRTANFMFNEIVAIGCIQNNNVTALAESNPDSISSLISKDVKILIGHNIKFDLLYLWSSAILQKRLVEGLKIWDTQLAEYILTAQQAKFVSLRKLATEKYRCKERTKIMEQYWENGIDTKNIPIEYVLEDVYNDVLDTEQIYLQQLEESKNKGMLNLINLQMDALLATTEMEFNGCYIDKEVFSNEKRILENKLQLLNEQTLQIATRYWK